MEFDMYIGDLSLFNGELLPDYGSVAETPYEGLKEGSFINEAVSAPTDKTSVHETLAHPQNGSQDLGLQDLLTETPRQDLPDLFPSSPAWLDTKTDLVDILTGVDNPLQENVQQVTVDSPPAPFPQQTLDVYSDLLLADLPNEMIITSPPKEDSNVAVAVHDAATLPSAATDEHIDYLDALNQAGLEQLLADAPDPNTASFFDAPVLSPVSADEVESILSSSPSSPSQDATLASLFSSFTSKPVTLDDEQVEEVLLVGPQRASREKARSAPYTVRTSTPSPAANPHKSKANRRERKKEQNRTAALRYREKKRSEQDVLQQEADELVEKNKALSDKVDSISREIKYLKDLMAEVEKARSRKIKKGGAS